MPSEDFSYLLKFNKLEIQLCEIVSFWPKKCSALIKIQFKFWVLYLWLHWNYYLRAE